MPSPELLLSFAALPLPNALTILLSHADKLTMASQMADDATEKTVTTTAVVANVVPWLTTLTSITPPHCLLPSADARTVQRCRVLRAVRLVIQYLSDPTQLRSGRPRDDHEDGFDVGPNQGKVGGEEARGLGAGSKWGGRVDIIDFTMASELLPSPSSSSPLRMPSSTRNLLRTKIW